MDAKQCMIVDLAKRGDRDMFMTERVSSIRMNENGQWAVQFNASPRVFHYNPSRLLYMTHPKEVDLEEKGLYMDNRHVKNIRELLCFEHNGHQFYHAVHNNGYYENLEAERVYVTRTRIDRNGGSVWDYLKALAQETGLTTEKDDNILSRQYELVDLKRDTVPLAQYMGSKVPLQVSAEPEQIYYPFGCNASQKQAVEQALTHQVSIIQGPPGTGKTQTILNIIAHLLMNGKTVLVVSNNNSAVENVEEKLSAEGLGFVVAKLGSVENKEAFIEHQTGYPDMSSWRLERGDEVKKTAAEALRDVSDGFEAQIRQAQLRAELDALQKEATYHEMLGLDDGRNAWLGSRRSATLLRLLHVYKRMAEQGKKPGLVFRIRWMAALGYKMYGLLQEETSRLIPLLESAFYGARRRELEKELAEATATLERIDVKRRAADLRSASLQLLKDRISRRYGGGGRQKFVLPEIKTRTEDFLKEYPVVLSTTYSAKSCINPDLVFDYVIMDEASQVDIKTGVLALSCAMNAVIVGDDKQLPNVISREEAQALHAIQSAFHVDDRYNAATHSFLSSCVEVFTAAPSTLLREHYRCHPKIIAFCNQRFYNDELITMTTDRNEKDVLKVVRTPKGNHARGLFNQREIDVICQEVLPGLADQGSVGIITPYRRQAIEINKAIGRDIASTVHKYQGRECDTIIMSMVDNEVTEFSDDPNLLNVAISRAKTRLCIVANGNEMKADSNLAQLIAYIQYNNFEVKESKLHSVFDLLYRQYTDERLAYEESHPKVSEYLSETLVYHLLADSIRDQHRTNIAVLAHYPLERLIADWEELDKDERVFAENPLTHIDFLLYNVITKRPLLAIEVDGWHFHRDSEVQQSRDRLKDRILEGLGLRLVRISTTDTVNEASVGQLIATV